MSLLELDDKILDQADLESLMAVAQTIAQTNRPFSPRLVNECPLATYAGILSELNEYALEHNLYYGTEAANTGE